MVANCSKIFKIFKTLPECRVTREISGLHRHGAECLERKEVVRALDFDGSVVRAHRHARGVVAHPAPSAATATATACSAAATTAAAAVGAVRHLDLADFNGSREPGMHDERTRRVGVLG